jgi:VCBS repeat protein
MTAILRWSFLVAALASTAVAQNFGKIRMISTHIINAQSVFAADLNGDGAVDVLSAVAKRIIWHKNNGGGKFGKPKVITDQAQYAKAARAADLDGDGDLDVLAIAWANGDYVAWFENLGGGTFGPQQVITTEANWAQSIYTIDLDGDGDVDVLSASAGDDKIAWYENLGGGTFGPQRVITTFADYATSVYAVDLDGDGDADVLSTAANDDTVAWFENLGGGTFGPQQVITTLADGAFSVHAADLDGDGDADVLSSSLGDRIAWYENLGGGAFGPLRVISKNKVRTPSIYAEDLDGDGDADVLAALEYYNSIVWYENLGGGTFGDQQVITIKTYAPLSVYAKDLDGDGDADVLSASYKDGKVAWYENFSAPVGSNYCGPANPNSSGQSATIAAHGSSHLLSDFSWLDAAGTATNQFGMFVTSRSQGFVMPPGSQGLLCLGGGIGRYTQNIMDTGPGGVLTLQLDLAQMPTPGGPVAIQPGETWNFQLWFRDTNPGLTSNFTDGLSITFQ